MNNDSSFTSDEARDVVGIQCVYLSITIVFIHFKNFTQIFHLYEPRVYVEIKIFYHSLNFF